MTATSDPLALKALEQFANECEEQARTLIAMPPKT